MNYKKEDMKFLNMTTREVFIPGANKIGGMYEIFEIEDELNIQEKIKFIDKFKDGLASYLINIIQKWEDEKDGLSKDNRGHIRTVSKKAWIKRNDPRKIIDNKYDIGKYYFMGNKYTELTLECPMSYGHRELYMGSHIANQWFHSLCLELKDKEQKYFESIDSRSIKFKKLKEYISMYGIFESDILNDIKWNGKDDLTEKDIDMYIKHFEKIDEIYKSVSTEIKAEEINRQIS